VGRAVFGRSGVPLAWERKYMWHDAGTSAAVISVSCPGGMARQFRVQVRDDETPSLWKLAGSFSEFSDASVRAEQLRAAGEETRVVACRALPTAA
jgi:hypothetical protein